MILECPVYGVIVEGSSCLSCLFCRANGVCTKADFFPKVLTLSEEEKNDYEGI